MGYKTCFSGVFGYDTKHGMTNLILPPKLLDNIMQLKFSGIFYPLNCPPLEVTTKCLKHLTLP